MKQILMITILTLITILTFGQKKSEIVQKGIKVQKQFEQNIENGDKEHVLIKEEFYDIKGDLVEVKEYKNKSIDKWFKYKYDDEANVIEEISLNAKGEQIERIVYKYQKSLRIERLTYDDKNRLAKSRKYEYAYR